MSEQKAVRKSRAMMVAAMMLFGTISLFVRNVALPSGEIALCRASMATLILGGYFLASGQKMDFRSVSRQIPLLLLSGMALGVNWIFLFEAFRYTTVSVATLSNYFAPVIVTVASPILFREKMTARQIVCFGFSTLGIVLITGVGDLGGSNTHGIGILFGLGAAVLYALVVLINKFIKNVAPMERTFLQFAAAAAVLLPYVLCTGGFHLGQLDVPGWVSLLILGIVHTGVTYCLYFSAVRDIPGQEVAILSYLDPLVAVAVSVFLLGEGIGILQLAGGALVLGFTLYNEMKT